MAEPPERAPSPDVARGGLRARGGQPAAPAVAAASPAPAPPAGAASKHVSVKIVAEAAFLLGLSVNLGRQWPDLLRWLDVALMAVVVPHVATVRFDALFAPGVGGSKAATVACMVLASLALGLVVPGWYYVDGRKPAIASVWDLLYEVPVHAMMALSYAHAAMFLAQQLATAPQLYDLLNA